MDPNYLDGAKYEDSNSLYSNISLNKCNRECGGKTNRSQLLRGLHLKPVKLPLIHKTFSFRQRKGTFS